MSTFLSRLPQGSKALTDREVLEGILERTMGEGPLAEEARKALDALCEHPIAAPLTTDAATRAGFDAMCLACGTYLRTTES